MKVLHVPYTYPPSAGGGTEVYVAQLCRRLEAHGITSVVAAPGSDDREAVVEGTRARWFKTDPEQQSLDVLYGAGDAMAADAFEAVLADERPDVVHQHAVSPACSLEVTRRVVRRGLPVVLTVHTPAVFCQQGALMRWGREPCTVGWQHAACTACVLSSHGVPSPVSSAITRMPAFVASSAIRLGLSGSAGTALRLPALMRQRLDAVDEVFRLATRVIALAPWVADILRKKGVDADRVVNVPHGIDLVPSPSRRRRASGDPLRLVHLGRLDPLKGTLLVAEAVAAVPSLPVTLDIFGLPGDDAGSAYAQAVRQVAARDARVRLHGPVAHEDVGSVLADYDAVLVPSQWMETGPLVVLEAFAAGLPVIGSRLGGIADKVRDGHDGLLIDEYRETGAWEAAIRRCVDDAALLPRLTAGVAAPPTMADVAGEMARIYGDIAQPERCAS